MIVGKLDIDVVGSWRESHSGRWSCEQPRKWSHDAAEPQQTTLTVLGRRLHFFLFTFSSSSFLFSLLNLFSFHTTEFASTIEWHFTLSFKDSKSCDHKHNYLLIIFARSSWLLLTLYVLASACRPVSPPRMLISNPADVSNTFYHHAYLA